MRSRPSTASVGAVLVALVLLVGACSGIDTGRVRTSDSATTSTTSTPGVGTTGSTGGGGPGSTTVAPTGSAPSTAVRDVADPTFPGLGDPRIDVGRYDVALVATPGRPAIEGTVRMRATVRTTEPLASFTLDLKALRVRSVVVDGKAAAVRADGDEIVITPSRPLRPGATFTTTTTYGGIPEPGTLAAVPGVAIGWQDDGHGGTFTLSEPDGTRTWMPVSDHPADKAVFHLTVDVPDGYQVVGNGRLAGVRPSRRAGRQVWDWVDPAPMASYLALVAIGHYDLVRRRGAGGVPVVEAYPTGTRLAEEPLYRDLDRILAFYSSQFGPYPFAGAGVIAVPERLDVALETQSRPLFGLGDGGSLAHELAHQWFGDDVSPRSWADTWLNEGFATFGSWLWTDHEGRSSLATQARAAYGRLGPSTPPVRGNAGPRAFDQQVYDRGALTLYAVRQAMGAEPFDRFLRAWVRERGGTSASTADLVALAGRIAGRDLAPLFTAWLDTPTVPPFPK